MDKQAVDTHLTNFSGLWPKILSLVRSELSDQSFKTWFSSISFGSFKEGVLVINVPDDFYGDWLKDHYQNIIQSAAENAIGFRPAISYCAVTITTAPTTLLATKRHLPGAAAGSTKSGLVIPNLNTKYVFDNFVVGSGNRFAHAAALAVSEEPAKQYNPLFIYGRVGLGKTHLLQAIAHDSFRRNRDQKIVMISSEVFTNRLITAIQTRSTKSFREKYRAADLLLIDDIHFIAGKESTQEEFFHTFNTLYDAHKQIVVTSDRPPKDIPRLEERLVSRFEWGLVADIQPPNLETRVAILKKLVEKQKVVVHNDVLFLIAEKIRSNIRELEGALVRVIAYSSLTGVTIDPFLVEGVLKDSFREEEGKVTIDQIQRCVSGFFSIKVSDLRARNRSRSIVFPRQIAMYLVRKLTSHSLPEIGDFFGGRGHATVLHAVNKIQREFDSNDKLRGVVEQLRCSIKK